MQNEKFYNQLLGLRNGPVDFKSFDLAMTDLKTVFITMANDASRLLVGTDGFRN